MFCVKCGNNLPNDAVFCNKCGLRVDAKSVDSYQAKRIDDYDNSQTIIIDQDDPFRYGEPSERRYDVNRNAADRKSKKTSRKPLIIALCGGGAGAVVIAAAIFVLLVFMPSMRYDNAQKLFKEGKYIDAFGEIDKLSMGYRDIGELYPYYSAYADFERGEYKQAARQFNSLGSYKNSRDMANECNYLLAERLLNDGKYDEAKTAFAALGDYKDSADKMNQYAYDAAMELLDAGEYEKAKSAFSALGDFKDSADKEMECSYNIASALLAAKNYGEAFSAFAALGNYKDAKEMQSECDYRAATDLFNAGDYDGAAKRFALLGNYKDSSAKATESLKMSEESPNNPNRPVPPESEPPKPEPVIPKTTTGKLNRTINETSNWICLTVYWGNYKKTVFERDRDSQVWTMLGRDGSFRLVDPIFALEGDVFTIGFPTTETKYEMNTDFNGRFGSEGMTWTYLTDESTSMGSVNGANATYGLSDAIYYYDLLTIHINWSNGDRTIFYKQYDGTWLLKSRSGAFSEAIPSFTESSNQVVITVPTIYGEYTLNSDGTGKFGSEAFKWEYSYFYN